jgi:hypothetical protein
MNFSGALCVLRLEQVLSPFQLWLAGPNPGDINAGPLTAGPETITIFSTSAVERANLGRLFMYFSSMLLYLNASVSQWFNVRKFFRGAPCATSQELKSTRSGFATKIESLTPAVALVIQYFITAANWDMAASAIENTVSFPIRWYVYGSGPRLFW